jgi:hypothetical protein
VIESRLSDGHGPLVGLTDQRSGMLDWSKQLNVTGGSIHLNAELEAKP